MINYDYVLIKHYVDNKTPRKEPVTVTENGKKRILRTIGDKWSYLQTVKFGYSAQPFYVLLNDEGVPLTKAYKFNESIPDYIDFLETGLKNFKNQK